MRVLVTGGAGFIGSHVVDLFVKENVETHVLVSGFRSSRHPDLVNKEAHVTRGNLLSQRSLETATKDMDVVCHLAGILSHYTFQRPALTIDVNMKGTWNLRSACIQNQVQRIIFASTSFIYGSTLRLERPRGLYGITKLAAEKILQSTYPQLVPYTILRLFNVYGPRSYPDSLYTSVTATWISKAIRREPLEIHDTGQQALDFVYVKDVAKAFVKSLNQLAENEIFDVGSGKPTTMNELAHLINTLTGNEAKPYYNPNHPAYLRYACADVTPIKTKLSWMPETSLVDGMRETIRFFKERIG